ncbi:hypothetical protein [Mycobacterium dioxanotrophicus]|nr:hypothetical protein [Mycobacterium dioxanotrophicus]
MTYTGLTSPADIYAGARLSARAGQLTLSTLATFGLVSRSGRTVALGTVTLDDVAAAHHLDDVQADRIARYRRERAAWHDWLALQDKLKGIIPATGEWREIAVEEPVPGENAEYLAAVLAHGPPPIDEEAAAIALVTEVMGARILVGAGT